MTLDEQETFEDAVYTFQRWLTICFDPPKLERYVDNSADCLRRIEMALQNAARHKDLQDIHMISSRIMNILWLAYMACKSEAERST